MPSDFARRLLAWYDRHGRHDLPWQHPREAYRVWIAEIMLQQTQVATVIPYFQRFIQRFPALPILAAAEQDAVLACWSGLGYYSRARNLHAAAKLCVERHAGRLPDSPDALAALPGIGRSTAAAICAQAFGQPSAILDGNVKRALCRLLGIEGWPGQPKVERELWQHAERLMPAQRCADYTQAIMDFGATLCTRAKPACGLCPFRSDCVALASLRIDRLPASRPRKPLPERSCAVIALLDDNGRVLLQRKPATGVWAGLWSLPQFDHESELASYANANGCSVEPQVLAPITHVFTHFRLQLQPALARIGSVARHVGDNDDLRWFGRADFAHIGMPAPIRTLLNSIEDIR